MDWTIVIAVLAGWVAAHASSFLVNTAWPWFRDRNAEQKIATGWSYTWDTELAERYNALTEEQQSRFWVEKNTQANKEFLIHSINQRLAELEQENS